MTGGWRWCAIWWKKPKPEAAPVNAFHHRPLYPSAADFLPSWRVRRRGAGGEIQLTDSMVKLIGRQPFHGLRFSGTRYDCGDKVGFIEANVAFALAQADMAGSRSRGPHALAGQGS